MSIVLDTSMTIAWLFEGERTEGALSALRRIAAQGGLVPSLWRLEVANVLRNAVRRGRCDEAFVSRALDRLARLPITIDSETDHHAWAATRDLAREEDLTLMLSVLEPGKSLKPGVIKVKAYERRDYTQLRIPMKL